MKFNTLTFLMEKVISTKQIGLNLCNFTRDD